ncbi:unnamed protein product [Paramecium sonneborni]|uniref:WD40-repeat-containing domain n=1 Tax=Paramecium sonneborni TaxID=65129 RepID=A0A8S1RR09_9CILI|nr:unnamed protein product [Paramecium sonneborni]
MDPQQEQNQPNVKKNEEQTNKTNNKDIKKEKQKPPSDLLEQLMNFKMPLRMQTGKDGINFENMAREFKLKGNFSKVIKDYLNTKQVKVSNDNRFIAVSDNQTINIIEIFENKYQEVPDLGQSVQIFEFNWNDSNILFTVSDNYIIRKCDKSNEIIMEYANSYTETNFSLNFSKQLNYLVYSYFNRPITLINLNDKKHYQIPIQGLYGIATISINEILVAISTSDSMIYLWNHEKEIVKENNLIYKKKIINLTFTNDDTELICFQDSIGVYYISEDLQIKQKYFWKIDNSTIYTFCPKHLSIFKVVHDQNAYIEFMNHGSTTILFDEKHTPINFHSTYNGNYIVSIDYQGLVIWDLKNNSQLLNNSQLCGNKVMLIQLKTLITGSEKEIKILDITNQENIQEIQTILFDQPIKSMQFSSTQEYFVCGFDNSIKVWRIRNDRQCQQVAISANGQFVIYKSEESLQLTNIRQKHAKELIFKSVSGLIYSSDFQNLITLINGTPKLFTSTLEPIETQLDSQFQDIEGQYIKSASIDSIFVISSDFNIFIVKILDKTNLTLIRKIPIEEQFYMVSLDINPLGTLLIAGNYLGSIYLWDLSPSSTIMNNSKNNLIIENQNDQIYDFTFSPNGTDFSAAVYDGSLIQYSIDLIHKTQNIKQNDGNQENSQVQVIDHINKQFRLICYKSFTRQSLILANKCIVKKAQINQNKQSIYQLFTQKGAIEDIE